MWGTVDVHTCTREVPCMGRRSTPSVGRLTVLHVVGVVRLQDACMIRSIEIETIYTSHTICGGGMC